MIRTTFFITAVVTLLLAGGGAVMIAQEAWNFPAANHLPINTLTANPRAVPSSEPQLEQRYPRYIIQRQDVLKISFPISPEMNQTVTVQPDGYIDLQASRGLHVQGLTVPQLVDALKKAYAGVLHDPIIDVDLMDFQKAFFTVSGQVGKPGKYDLRSDLTVAEALAIAGGMTPEARTQILLFHQSQNGWVETKKINMKDILRGKNVNEDARITPGDMIYVPEKFIANFKKYVPYSVSGGTYVSPVP